MFFIMLFHPQVLSLPAKQLFRRFSFPALKVTVIKKTVREYASELLFDERSEEFSREAYSRRFCTVSFYAGGFSLLLSFHRRKERR